MITATEHFLISTLYVESFVTWTGIRDTLRVELTTLSTKLVMSEEIINTSTTQFVSPTQNDPEELTTQGDKCNAFLARIEKLDLDMHNSQQA